MIIVIFWITVEIPQKWTIEISRAMGYKYRTRPSGVSTRQFHNREYSRHRQNQPRRWISDIADTRLRRRRRRRVWVLIWRWRTRVPLSLVSRAAKCVGAAAAAAAPVCRVAREESCVLLQRLLKFSPTSGLTRVVENVACPSQQTTSDQQSQ